MEQTVEQAAGYIAQRDYREKLERSVWPNRIGQVLFWVIVVAPVLVEPRWLIAVMLILPLEASLYYLYEGLTEHFFSDANRDRVRFCVLNLGGGDIDRGLSELAVEYLRDDLPMEEGGWPVKWVRPLMVFGLTVQRYLPGFFPGASLYLERSRELLLDAVIDGQEDDASESGNQTSGRQESGAEGTDPAPQGKEPQADTGSENAQLDTDPEKSGESGQDDRR